MNEFEQVNVIRECHNAIRWSHWDLLTDRQTDTTENITSPQTMYAGGNEAELW